MPKRGYRVLKDERLFTLEVFLIGGPMTNAFIKKHPIVSRTFQLRGDNSLGEFHAAIFDAFDREDEHLYQFEIGGKAPMDPDARRYVTPIESGPFADEKPAGTVYATIGSLDLKKGDVFGYWFDFGDDWWHQINVVSIDEKSPRGKYPKLVKRVGKSPPQYADLDE